jgi:hypothetical protein
MDNFYSYILTGIAGFVIGVGFVLSATSIASINDDNGKVSMHYQKHLYRCEIDGGKHE